MERVLRAVERVRWVFLPLGLCALVAVGAHAAAEVVSGRLLSLVDLADAALDSLWSRWSVTAPLVDWVGLEQRTLFSRGVALLWELAADFLLALPMLGYDERAPAEEVALARALLRKAVKRPTLLRVSRPVAALLLGMAGAASVARMLQGSIQLALHASTLAHLIAVLTLFSLLILIVPRAGLRALEHAELVSSAKTRGPARAATLGLFGTALLLPLALAALAASPLYAFFR